MAVYYIVAGVPRDEAGALYEMLHGTYDRDEAHDEAGEAHQYKMVRVVRLANASSAMVEGCMRELRTMSSRVTAKGVDGYGRFDRADRTSEGTRDYWTAD